MKIYHYIAMLAVTLSVTACAYTNHFLDEDEREEVLPYSTLQNVKVSAYDTWTYIDLKTGKMETHPDAGEWIYGGTGGVREAQQAEPIGIEWHIAVHRYEFKTNGASVLNTGKTDMANVTTLPEGSYTPDAVLPYETEKDKMEGAYLLSMDMAGMMAGNIGYAHNPSINLPLCEGITRTPTGTMPPVIYGNTDKVFVLKWDDGSWATLQITGVVHTVSGVSNYLSFNYKYNPAK
ncbi:HmuY family protein [Bacteroides helcogenes]|uniref:Lipoprotein n=1 Tax=Bacteroides helcogenes (strain ATCC 35417 / DSM 20613 / JCM 6297 / CCUG 15421 / P 36-108) TaxID=693979 RepID=E6SRR5_BACT6|nr:HmuY family protein [Bacteroides helcogenes]ADV45155.1 hypothetical protein Bache_3231 [Bacteroides helcogenes P 36-108]MDY5238714.1 HmuY family protein [Bacteroides helcogenes]